MRLDKALKEKLLDVRLRDRLVVDGKISQAEVDTYLKALADESGNFENTIKDSPEDLSSS